MTLNHSRKKFMIIYRSNISHFITRKDLTNSVVYTWTDELHVNGYAKFTFLGPTYKNCYFFVYKEITLFLPEELKVL